MFGDNTVLAEPDVRVDVVEGAPGTLDAEALAIVMDTVDEVLVLGCVAGAIPCMVVVASVLDGASHIAMSLSKAGVGVGAGEGRGSCTGTGRGGRSGT